VNFILGENIKINPTGLSKKGDIEEIEVVYPYGISNTVITELELRYLYMNLKNPPACAAEGR
jgi:hypothetical protein